MYGVHDYDDSAVFLSSYAADKSTVPNVSPESYDQVIEEEEAMPVSTQANWKKLNQLGAPARD